MTTTTAAGGSGDRAALESLVPAELRALNAQSDQVGRFFPDLHGISATEFQELLHVRIGDTSDAPLTARQLQRRLGLTSFECHLPGETRDDRRSHTARYDRSDRRKALLHYEDQGMALARDFCTHLGDVDRAAMLMRALGA